MQHRLGLFGKNGVDALDDAAMVSAVLPAAVSRK